MPRIALLAAAALALSGCQLFRSRTPKATGPYKVVVYSDDENAEPLARALQFEALVAQRTLLENGRQPPFEILPSIEGPGVNRGTVTTMPAGSSTKELQELCTRLGADLLIRAEVGPVRAYPAPQLLLFRPEKMDLLAAVNEDDNRQAAARKAVDALVQATNALLREDERAGEVMSSADLWPPEPGSSPPPPQEQASAAPSQPAPSQVPP